MNMKRLIPFYFYYLGDGTSKTVVLNLVTDSYLLSPGWTNGVPVPSGVRFTTNPGDGSTVTNLLSVITLTLASAPASGTVGSFSGFLEF
jgi:hypothetical protein